MCYFFHRLLQFWHWVRDQLLHLHRLRCCCWEDCLRPRQDLGPQLVSSTSQSSLRHAFYHSSNLYLQVNFKHLLQLVRWNKLGNTIACQKLQDLYCSSFEVFKCMRSIRMKRNNFLLLFRSRFCKSLRVEFYLIVIRVATFKKDSTSSIWGTILKPACQMYCYYPQWSTPYRFFW